jgi:hypothetical protein
VISAVGEFVKSHPNVSIITFTADEQSRAKMYDTLAKRVSRQLGWHVIPYDEMAQDPKMQTVMSYGDFVFAIERGTAPEHRQAAQKPQHGEFLPIFYVYSVEDPSAPAIKIKARNANEAEYYVRRNVPEYKNLEPMGIMASKQPRPDARDMGTAPKPPPKPQPRQMNPLEKELHNKLNR